jgi:hypothetical protein
MGSQGMELQLGNTGNEQPMQIDAVGRNAIRDDYQSGTTISNAIIHRQRCS